MHAKQIGAFLLGVFLVVGIFVVTELNTPRETRIIDTAQKVSSLPKNATYIIQEKQFQLFEGESKQEYMAGRDIVETVALYEEPAYGDIDGDGDDDALVILLHESGKTDTSYYAAIAWYERGKYTGTDTVLLGDRVEIDSYSIEDGRGTIVFRTRAADGSFAQASSTEHAIAITLNTATGRARVINK